MSIANKYLFNSLLCNLREMTNLIKLMRGKIGDVKCSSWRHPLLPCGELDVFQMLEDNKDCDRYTYLLELTFDRLIYLLNLIVKYMESCDALATFKPRRNVERPQNLSMASILYMLWDRIQAHCESRIVPSKSDHCESLTISSFTQSDITSISSCTSCQLAQNLVTQIVLKIESYFEDDPSLSAILTERTLMKEKLMGTSNLSAMTVWVNAILKDLNVMQEESQRFKADIRKLKGRIDSREVNLMAELKKHEDEAAKLQRLSREQEEKIKAFEMEVKMLRQDRQNQRQELADLKSRYPELDKKVIELEMRKKALEETLIKMEKLELEKVEEWKTKFDSESKWRESALAEVENLKTSLEDMKSQVAEERSRCVTLEMKVSEAEEKIRILKEENAKLQESLDEKQQEVDKFANKFLEAFPDISNSAETMYKGTGDPLTDMRHQIEANNLRIAQLTAHNDNLTQTITRMAAIKK